MRAEILIDSTMAARGARILDAMIAAAPIPIIVRENYVGDCEILMTYGTGHPIRRPWWQKHLRRGGRCIGWDLGYWKHKDDGTCRMRVTVDKDHPPHLIRSESAERWQAEGITLREDADPRGPVVIVGLGQKSVRTFGLRPLEWERGALAMVRRKFPENKIVFRPKRDTDLALERVHVVHGPIEQAIKGASLVVCRHSNVAVDACIAGIPVICEDGAAFALYKNNPNPTTEQRLQFLQGLAWWQWKPEEANQAWKYLLNRLCD